MIKHIFHDLDNCHIFSDIHHPEQNHIKFNLENDEHNYFTIIRPCAKRLIDFSRQLVGEQNVFILTTSTRPYARKINELALFGFNNDQIFSREDIAKYTVHQACGGYATIPHELAHKENVLIDDLPSRYNENKVAFIGIGPTVSERYLEIRPYYGVNFAKDPFEQEVMEFLQRNHNYKSRETF
jgi:hypothetical protein